MAFKAGGSARSWPAEERFASFSRAARTAAAPSVQGTAVTRDEPARRAAWASVPSPSSAAAIRSAARPVPWITRTGRSASRLFATSRNAISPPLMSTVADGAPAAIAVATLASHGDSSPQDEPGTSTKCV
jgi:hypothetical protein